MAKTTGMKITIAMIVTALGLVWGIWRIGGKVWDQGATHAAEATTLKTTVKRVDKLEPEVKLNTEGRTEVKTNMKWIMESLVRIEEKI